MATTTSAATPATTTSATTTSAATSTSATTSGSATTSTSATTAGGRLPVRRQQTWSMERQESESSPVLPLFAQMNVCRDDHWRETSRWVRFEEDVEDNNQRWSKPYVPTLQLYSLLQLKQSLQEGIVALDLEAENIDEIVDKIKANLANAQVAEELRAKLNLRTRVLMKLKLAGRVSSALATGISTNSLNSENEQSNKPNGNQASPRPIPRANSTSEECDLAKSVLKRTHNAFTKKVPRGAESCLIQVATLSSASETTTIFVRLRNPCILSDFCEISAPTRFIAFLIGPESKTDELLAMGKALGTLMADQVFPLIAYKAMEAGHLIASLESYVHQATIVASSAWDPKIRLEPPKSLPSFDDRLTSLQRGHQNSSSQAGIQFEASHASRPATPGPEAGDHFALLNVELIHQEEQVNLEQSNPEINSDEDDSLEMTGKLFGGLMNDIRRKKPHFISDFVDGLNMQCLAAVMYIYLATITKAITFGGFLSDATDDLQGVLESFMGHALAGGIFCLLAGQPLTVLGCTGPVLIFEKILFDFTLSYGLDYMVFRLWIGLWCSLMLILVVAFDLSSVVRYFTRFTEESFAALIGLIFIFEALNKLVGMNKSYPVRKHFDPVLISVESEQCRCLPGSNATQDVMWSSVNKTACIDLGGHLSGSGCDYVADVLFFSVLLFFGTFTLAMTLKHAKTSPFFPAWIRNLLSDYAVIIAICLAVAVDLTFGLKTPKLIVPTEFKPTRSDVRGWLIPWTKAELSVLVYVGALVPASLLAILLFMDQQITAVIVNRKEHKLRKGCGYHLDMLIVAVMIAVCSILGLPFCVAATVLCLGHVDALKMQTESQAPGEQPQFLGVREQRVTGILVFLLTGLSVKLAPILKFIPMPVLYGVLMYMGVSSLRGMQFVDRVFLLFMPPKHQPDHVYLRHVPLKKVHLFTLLQLLCLLMLWVIKISPASLVFPLMVLALVGLRRLLDFTPWLMTQNDLFYLDNLMPDRKKRRSQHPSNVEEKFVTALSQAYKG